MTSNRFIYFILFAFIAGCLLVISIQYYSDKNINNLISGSEKLLNELRIGSQLREMERDLLSVEIKIRGAVAAYDTTYLQEVDSQIVETKSYLTSLKRLSDQDSTTRNINRLIALADQKIEIKNLILDSMRRSGGFSSENFKAFMKRRMLANEVNNISRKIYSSRQRLLDSITISVSNSGRKARTWGTVLIVIVLGSGAILFWYTVGRIRHQNHLIHQLDLSEKKIREVSMIKENFMANMSHEIRTPMNAILGFNNLLKNKNQDPALVEFIEAIRKAGENLVAIINDILDISKIEAGMMRIESSPFSIRALIHSIQTMFTEKIHEKGLKFSLYMDESIPETLSGDATRLTQILVNMIGNAIKFTPEGEVHVEVKNLGQAGNKLLTEFVIKDTGIGIEKEKLTGIFERFRQAEDSITRKYGGTGLGLSITKDLILLQKGTIDVESKPGAGSTFRFTIPYDIAAVKLENKESPEATEYDSLPHNIKVLVVEDNEMNQTLIKHQLNGWQLSFDMAGNGIEAVEMMRKNRYHLVLMDIQMPGMDGYTATQEIRLKLKMDTPIIAMTAHAFAGEREKCLSYGMSEYIAKPIDERELRKLIGQFTGHFYERRIAGNDINKKDNEAYQFINLEYMREISNGDRKYERTVTGQFIDAIPLELETLESAFKSRDKDKLRRTAHNLKTTASIMGLPAILQEFLDQLENDAFDESRFQQILLAVKIICMNALPEARHFYSSL